MMNKLPTPEDILDNNSSEPDVCELMKIYGRVVRDYVLDLVGSENSHLYGLTQECHELKDDKRLEI